MTTNPTISAPNTDIVDDSLSQIASRVVARIKAKGLGVQGVYVDDWSGSHRSDIVRLRGWSIDVVPSNEGDPLDQPLVGAVEIMETENVHMTKYRGVGVPVRTTARHFSIGYAGDVVALKALLGVRDE
jgi:hypothetical protein